VLTIAGSVAQGPQTKPTEERTGPVVRNPGEAFAAWWKENRLEELVIRQRREARV